MRYPLHEVGALLEAKAIHPGRSARNHLRWLADSNAIPRRRVDEVLEQVGLTSVARKRAGGFSLGMGQRLGIAAALLGDPGVLLLDEPVNGLDPEGIQWVRNLLRSLAAEGRTVFVSSHLMSEMALTADFLIVVGRGRLIAEGTVADIIDNSSSSQVRISSPHLDALTPLLTQQGAIVSQDGAGAALVKGLTCRDVGTCAGQAGITLWELSPQQASLEEAFIKMTRDSGEFHAGSAEDQPQSAQQAEEVAAP